MQEIADGREDNFNGHHDITKIQRHPAAVTNYKETKVSKSY